ncbi:Gfo/Idh/MocA family protein [Luteimonas mephitis]|uniref:Gfo/Idh/MocA family protein n=1 Tax=Luteimonas mephitis TaxID=83615 RepID=UPI003A937BDD
MSAVPTPAAGPLRAGIVGCGKIADGHAEQLRAIGRAQLVAACDREPLMTEQFQQRWGGMSRHGDLAAMIRGESLDVVHLATPPDSHVALACTALEMGCHVFVEKPFALDAAGARRILDCADANARRVGVNYLYNFETPALELQRLLADGALGEVVHVDLCYGYNLAGDYGMAVMADPAHWVHRLPGKLFHNVLDHVLAKVAPLLADPVSVHAVAQRRRPATGDAAIDAMPDELRFMLCGANGLTVSGMVSSHARPIGHTMKVYGSRDTVELDYAARTLVRSARQTQPSALGRLFPPWVQGARHVRSGLRNVGDFARHRFHYFQCMRRLLDDFYDAIEGRGEDPVTHSQILRVATIIDAIVVALEERR